MRESGASGRANPIDDRVVATIVRWTRRQAIARGQPPAHVLREMWEDHADGCEDCGMALGDLSVEVALDLPDAFVEDVDRFIRALRRWERLAYVAMKASHDADTALASRN